MGAGSALDGVPVVEVQRTDGARLLGIRTGRGDQTLWAPPLGRPIVRTDRLVVVATRAGLGQLLARGAAAEPAS